MKFRVNKWLSGGLALVTLLGLMAPTASANIQQNSKRSYQTIQPVTPKRNRGRVTISQITSIPNQSYTNYVTGQNALYTLPGTVRGSRLIYGRRTMQYYANRGTLFMAYQRATTNRGSVYYKIVSKGHSVRGWMYQDALRSILNRQQQAANLNLGNQIQIAEIQADQSKHVSLINHTPVNLESAQGAFNKARTSVKSLKGTPNYRTAQKLIRLGQNYLRQVKAANPNAKTINCIETIRAKYNQATHAVKSAQSANLHHHPKVANRDVRRANRDLRNVSRILNQIHNRYDRKVAHNLFNHALDYVNINHNLDSSIGLNGYNLSSRYLSNSKIFNLIDKYEADAESSIINLYPNLGDFDVALMDAYRAQTDLDRAQDLVVNLKGSHTRKAELNNIQATQHDINNLWNL